MSIILTGHYYSGVLEHFNFEDRVKALIEYSRILKQNGVIILGYPNHYSIPYRVAYLILNLFKKWPYPKEYKIFDMKKELEKSNLILEKREILSKESVFNWLSFFKILQMFIKKTDKIFNYEGYLTVLVVRKKQL